MKNKVLIRVVIPELFQEFEIFIPVNERVAKIKQFIAKGVGDLIDDKWDASAKYSIIDADTGNIYDSRMAVRDTKICNGKRVLFVKSV